MTPRRFGSRYAARQEGTPTGGASGGDPWIAARVEREIERAKAAASAPPPKPVRSPPVELSDLAALSLGEDEMRALVPTANDLDAVLARWSE